MTEPAKPTDTDKQAEDKATLLATGAPRTSTAAESRQKEAEAVKVKQTEILHKKIQDTLGDYKHIESNIPVSHPYWQWQNELKGLKNS